MINLLYKNNPLSNTFLMLARYRHNFFKKGLQKNKVSTGLSKRFTRYYIQGHGKPDIIIFPPSGCL